MKPEAVIHRFLAISCTTLLAISSASAQTTYYWDSNDATTGFGTAGGTWTDPTAGTLTSGWSTSSTGINVVDGNSVSTTTTDTLWFGTNTATYGLAAGTINITGTVNAGNLTQGNQSGAITLSGGTLNLGSTSTITVANTMVIDSLITGAGTSLTKAGNGVLRLSNTANTYTGATLIGASTNGVLEATFLANGGVASSIGASSSAASNLVLSNINTGILRYIGTANASSDRLFTLGNQQGYPGGFEVTGSGTLNLTNTGSVAFAQANAARIFSLGGTNTGLNTLNARLIDNGSGALSFTKTGAGTWVVANEANSYTGQTRITTGTLIVSKMANYGDDSSIGKGTTGTSIAMGSASSLVYTGTVEANTDRSIDFTSAGANLASTVSILNNGTGALNFTAATFNTGSNNSNNRHLTLGGTNGGTISGAIRNTGTTTNAGYIQVVKNGSGTWTMAGNNDYAGDTTINAGTLRLDYSTNDTSKLSDVATVGFLRLNGGTLELSGGSHVETVLSTTLNNGTTFIKRTSGTATLSMGAITFSGGAIDFAADNIATTSTGVTNGILNVRTTVAGTNFAMKSGSNIVAYDYVTNGVTDYTGAAMATTSNYLLTSNAANTLAGTTSGNSLKIANTSAGSLAVGANTLTLSGLLFAGSADYDLTTSGAGRITPAVLHNYATNGAVLNLGALGGVLTQFGTGTTVLTAAAQANAGVNVNGGTVQFSTNAQLGTPSNGAAISLNNGTLRGNTAGGNIALNNSGANSRNISLGSGGGTLDVIGGGMLTVSGVISATTANHFATLTIGSGSSNGTIEFTGANTYTGITKVNGGKLLVNNTTGSGTGTGAVNVADGATLGGSGTISGATTIAGNLNPGNSPGLLSFGSSLTLETTAVTTMEINGLTRGTEYDAVNVSGQFTYAGDLIIQFATTLASDATFNLFDFGSQTGSFDTVTLAGSYTGSLTNSGGVWSLTSGGNSWTFTQSTGDLTFMAIPEPKAALLGVIGLLLLLRRRR